MKYTMLFPLFLALFVCFTKAIPQNAIDALCRETHDYKFCLDSIGRDPRTLAARDYKGVLLVAISETQNEVVEGQQHLEEVRGRITDPLGKKRLGVCDSNYKNAFKKFRAAYDKANQGAFLGVIDSVRDGTNAVIECGNTYRRDGPIQECPLSFYNDAVFKFSEIILIVDQKLLT